MTTEAFLIEAAIYSVLLPVGVGIWRFSNLEREAKLLLYMLIPVAANQCIANWWLQHVSRNNIPFYHLYIIIEIAFISWIYYSYLKKSRNVKLIPIITISFIALYLLSLIVNPGKLWRYSTYERAIEAGIVLVFVGSYFINIYKRQEIMHLHKASGFWIGFGLVLYFACNLTVFAFSELVFAQESSVFQSIWAIHAILTLLLYISFTIALTCRKTETTS
jgi:hypothetical protein